MLGLVYLALSLAASDGIACTPKYPFLEGEDHVEAVVVGTVERVLAPLPKTVWETQQQTWSGVAIQVSTSIGGSPIPAGASIDVYFGGACGPSGELIKNEHVGKRVRLLVRVRNDAPTYTARIASLDVPPILTLSSYDFSRFGRYVVDPVTWDDWFTAELVSRIYFYQLDHSEDPVERKRLLNLLLKDNRFLDGLLADGDFDRFVDKYPLEQGELLKVKRSLLSRFLGYALREEVKNPPADFGGLIKLYRSKPEIYRIIRTFSETDDPMMARIASEAMIQLEPTKTKGIKNREDLFQVSPDTWESMHLALSIDWLRIEFDHDRDARNRFLNRWAQEYAGSPEVRSKVDNLFAFETGNKQLPAAENLIAQSARWSVAACMFNEIPDVRHRAAIALKKWRDPDVEKALKDILEEAEREHPSGEAVRELRNSLSEIVGVPPR